VHLPSVFSRSHFAIVLVALAVLVGATTARRWVADDPTLIRRSAPTSTSHVAARPTRATSLPAPSDLVDVDLGLRSGPIRVPLELRVPAIGLQAAVAGVGITSEDVMDAPMGPAGDPVW
jgi:hypothetical protein